MALVWLIAAILWHGVAGDLGLWHFVDVRSLVCPGGKGWYAATIPSPTSGLNDPHIFSMFRSTTQSATISFVARDAGGEIVSEVSDLTLHAVSGRRLDAAEVNQRRLWGSTRRRSSQPFFSPRRRTPQAPVPSPYYSPRRRAAPEPVPSSYSDRRRAAEPPPPPVVGTRRRVSPAPDGTSGGAVHRRRANTGEGSTSVQRRRGYVAGGPRRRYTGYSGSSNTGDGRFSNQQNPGAGHYGYPNQNAAYQNFHGYPAQTPYGYSGAGAYKPGMGSGTKIALAAAGGMLAGGLIGHAIEGYAHQGWNGFGDHCSSGSWAGSCNDCSKQYGAEKCYVDYKPPVAFTRDDIMTSGFVPADHVWPITINFTHLDGSDFAPERVCPPAPTPVPTAVLTTTAAATSAAAASVRRLAATGGADLFVSLAKVDQLSDKLEDGDVPTKTERFGGGAGLVAMLFACCGICSMCACAARLMGGKRRAAEPRSYSVPGDYSGDEAPVSNAVAAGFVRALRSEYMHRTPNAVGAFLETLPETEQAILEGYEDDVRSAANPEAAIGQLEAQFGLAGGFGGAPSGYAAVPTY